VRHALFDLRHLLALLFAVYGTVLTVLGAAFTSAADRAKAAGWNVNLWSGIAMLALAAAFAAWALLRPLDREAPSRAG
jgi:hypothetical protein